MKNDADHKFLATLRSSPLGAKIVDDAEKGRLARRREALKKEAAIRATEAKFMDKLRAGEAEIADRRNIFEAADMALREAGAELYMARQRVDTLRDDREREEGAARSNVLRDSNPRRHELLWEPLRLAAEQSRNAPLLCEAKSPGINPVSKMPLPKENWHSLPSILARIEFLTRAASLANGFILSYPWTTATIRLFLFARRFSPPRRRLIASSTSRPARTACGKPRIAK